MKKVVVFDLDETLGYFTEFGIFCDCLNSYFKNNKYSDNNFNLLLDMNKEFLRPKIIDILKYIKNKKKEKKCDKVMIYTNNQGPKSWCNSIVNYFEEKIDNKLFDQVIAAFKIHGKKIEMKRTSHDKSLYDFVTCTKLPYETEICFIDDVYHPDMNEENVYYINVKPYIYSIQIEVFIKRFLNSKLGKNIDKNHFENYMMREFKKFNYYFNNKTKEEQEIDIIISKRIMEHLKTFFKDKTGKTLKKKKRIKRNYTYKL